MSDPKALRPEVELPTPSPNEAPGNSDLIPTASLSPRPVATSWRDVLRIHPAAEMFPTMDAGELAELEQKRSLIEKLIKAAPEKSNRHIAGTAKASHVTVGAIRENLEATGQIDQLDKTVGKESRAFLQGNHEKETRRA